MKPTEMLKEIKNLLGIELSAEVEEVQAEETKVELAQMTLENGTVLEAEEFVAGQEVFIVTEEDRIALPVGEYELEDGQILVVEEEGLIADIKAKEEPTEEPAEEVEEVEAAEEYVSKEEFAQAIEEIKAMIESFKKDEMAAEVEAKVKEELSATPAVAPLKHNPEGETKKQSFTYATKRNMSTRDKVLSKIANFK